MNSRGSRQKLGGWGDSGNDIHIMTSRMKLSKELKKKLIWFLKIWLNILSKNNSEFGSDCASITLTRISKDYYEVQQLIFHHIGHQKPSDLCWKLSFFYWSTVRYLFILQFKIKLHFKWVEMSIVRVQWQPQHWCLSGQW